VGSAVPGRWGMLVEPDLDRGVLAAALQRHYGLAAGAMHFIPAGETAWCYRVTDERGGRWFLKLARPGAIEQARTEFALRLGGALADLGLSVPRPRPTRAGELWCWIGGLQVAVFEFIHGQPLRDQDLGAAAMARQAARLVAAVHAATPALAVRVPFVETFEVWTDGLRGCLAEIEPGTGGADELRAQARALVWPQRTALLGMLERLQALGDTARSRPRERVLCHGDLIGDNMLGDRGGRLWAVDWDGAALAPRERDLALFSGQGFERFLDDYEGDAGTHGLDPDLVAFFLLRRNLDDLVDWLGALLTADRPEEQQRGNLDGVRWCLSRWDALEARIQDTRLVLARRHRRRRER
jgi:spectinomycin phosphotransferase